MIDETEELLNGRISAQIEPEVEKVHDVIDECRTYVSETMNEKVDFDNGFTKMMENEQKAKS